MTANPAKDYKQAQIDKLSKIKIGKCDDTGCIITHIIWIDSEFVVYEAGLGGSKSTLHVKIEPWEEDDPKNYKGNYLIINTEIQKLATVKHMLDDTNRLNNVLAQILVQGIVGNFVSAKERINEFCEQIRAEYSEKFDNRLRYLFTILACSILLIISSVIIYSLDLFTYKILIRNLTFSATAGVIGGYISVSYRLKKLIVDKNVNWYLYSLYGLERTFISIFCGVVVYFLIDCNLAFGIVNSGSNPVFGKIIFSFVAGFSETLIPNILMQLENNNKIENNK
jgi:hypothetical protein